MQLSLLLPRKVKSVRISARLKSEIPLHLMILPAVIIVFIFRYIPLGGLIISFEKFDIVNFAENGLFGSKWIGLDNFKFVFGMPEFPQVMWNTIYIAFMKAVAGFIAPIVLALLLNELRVKWFKRSIQTLTYLPHFLSWIILGGILQEILSLDGIVNRLLGAVHIDPVFFLGSNNVFPYMLVVTEIWRSVGWGTIIYLAAMTSINPELYEATVIDGANRLQQTWHVTLPSLVPIIVLIGTLSLGSLLDAGFDQVFVLYNPLVYQSGDIIDTLTYRIGFQQARYDIGTAIGLFRSAVGLILISTSYFLASKFADYKIF